MQRLQELTLEARGEIDRDPRLPDWSATAADQVGPAARSYGAFADLAATRLNRERLDVGGRALQPLAANSSAGSG